MVMMQIMISLLLQLLDPVLSVQIILGIEEEREGDWPWQLNLTNNSRYIREIELVKRADFYKFHSFVSWELKRKVREIGHGS
ncbi:hypothetical protein SLEP1_g25913 [Rubroshorea leprosula]|uniref:Secreted protein n=1 Tax=Rubroshorea leprosula TaxID=152421 RepID=A0AAV5JKK9_9ROSI|nr:hypothetical protein SLEP1_g25913 [Rubroshorea leprosula]